MEETRAWVGFIAGKLAGLAYLYTASGESRRREASARCLDRIELLARSLWGDQEGALLMESASEHGGTALDARECWLAAGSASLALAVACGMDPDPCAEGLGLLAADCCRSIREQALEPLPVGLVDRAVRLARGAMGDPASVVGGWLAED